MVDEDFAWRLAQELVRIDSSDPGAYENEIERYIKALVEERLARLNYPTLDAIRIEELEVLPGRRNLMITVPGLSDEPRLVYICHMDTVTLGNGWDADIAPLGAVVRNDKLYGRGACDMKGGLACAITALAHTLERVAADRSRRRTRGARGSRLKWPASRLMQASLGRAQTPSPPWPRSCVRSVARLRRCPRTMSWDHRPSRLAKSRADIAPMSCPTAPKSGSTCV